MRKKNQGFTLIEIMIAIAVLSTMAGVLFQTFVVSRRINAKSREKEIVLDAAKRTMEELKAFSFDDWEQNDKKSSDTEGTVKIGEGSYEYEPLPASGTEAGDRNGYLLKREFRNPGTEEGEADYLILAEADSGWYGRSGAEEEEDIGEDIYSINNYRMPNIADVSSFQNIVIDPMMLTKDDPLWVEELLAKVNPEEEEEEAEEEEDAGSDGKVQEEEAQAEYTEDSIRKYLCLDLKETPGSSDGTKDEEEPDITETEKKDYGKLTAAADSVYTVSDRGMSLSGFSPEQELTITFPLSSYKKTIEMDLKSEKPVNRIYLFLPAASEMQFDGIYVTADLKRQYELYVIVQDGSGISKSNIFIRGNTGDKDRDLLLYTNLNEEKPVSLYQPENRLYRVSVTVYEADYDNAGEDKKPVPGKELLKLDSTKTEN